MCTASSSRNKGKKKTTKEKGRPHLVPAARLSTVERRWSVGVAHRSSSPAKEAPPPACSSDGRFVALAHKKPSPKASYIRKKLRLSPSSSRSMVAAGEDKATAICSTRAHRLQHCCSPIAAPTTVGCSSAGRRLQLRRTLVVAPLVGECSSAARWLQLWR
jgi:hypothetical protein